MGLVLEKYVADGNKCIRKIIMVAPIKLIVLIFLVCLQSASCNSQVIKNDKVTYIINKYIQLNNEIVELKNTDSLGIKRQYFENWVEDTLHPTLRIIELLFCEKKDSLLLADYLNLIVKTQNSADESPILTLGNLYICNPHLVIRNIKNSSDLIKLLKLAFENTSIHQDRKIGNYNYLKKLLDDL